MCSFYAIVCDGNTKSSRRNYPYLQPPRILVDSLRWSQVSDKLELNIAAYRKQLGLRSEPARVDTGSNLRKQAECSHSFYVILSPMLFRNLNVLLRSLLATSLAHSSYPDASTFLEDDRMNVGCDGLRVANIRVVRY